MRGEGPKKEEVRKGKQTVLVAKAEESVLFFECLLPMMDHRVVESETKKKTNIVLRKLKA